jgi:hypothetical protein
MSGTKSRQVRNAEIKVITDLLDKWKSDKEIMAQLNIASATYYRYKSSIYKQDKKLLDRIRTDELAHRTMQVRNSLEYCISVNKKICESSTDDKAKIEASAMIVKAQMGLLNLALEPPYKEQIKIIARDVEQDTTKKLEQSI